MSVIPLPQHGLLKVMTPDQATQAIKEQQSEGVPQVSPLPSLVAYFRDRWEAAKLAKEPVARQMLKNMRRRKGMYEASEVQSLLEIGGSQGFYRLVPTKCNAAVSWIMDILLQPGDRPWGVSATPIPDISPEVKDAIRAQIKELIIQEALMQEAMTGQPINVAMLGERIKAELDAAYAQILEQEKEYAKDKAENMEDLIEDQLVEGRFYDILPQLIEDLVTTKAMIIKGPVIRRKKSRAWKRGANGKYEMSVEQKLVRDVDRISPLDHYPAPGSTGPDDGAQITRHRFTRKDLYELIGVPGYDEAAIRRILAKHSRKGLKEWLWTDSERDALRSDNNYLSTLDDTKIDTLELWDCIPGSILKEWGMQGIDDPEAEYEVNAFMVDGEIFRAVLNPDKLGRRPLSVASFIDDPDGFWGESVPELCEDDQVACNTLYRGVQNNSSLASGPMVEENIDRRAPGESGGIYPLKTWEVTDEQITGTPAVRLYNVQYNADKMMNVLRSFAEMADDHSQIPAYAHGNENVGGAGDTASGLNMLMAAASKGIKTVVRNIDGALRDLLTRYYDHNMLYHDDDNVKGDLKIVARGSTALIIKEQTTIRLREFLQMVDNSPNLSALAGKDGLAHLAKEAAKGMSIEADKAFPDQEELIQTMQNMMQPAQMPPENGETIDAAGNPVAGGDVSQVQGVQVG